MKFIWNIWPMKNYAAITLPWGVFFNPNCQIRQEIVRHEMKHVEQIKRLGVIRFYSQYLWEYACNLIHFGNHNDAYMAISFEIEARSAEWH